MRCRVRSLVRVLAAILLLLPALSQAADLRLGLAVELNTLDPHLHNFGGNKAFMPNLYDTLTAADADGRIVPRLAAAWTRVDDTTLDITLRPGVTFSDGTPFTAEDVTFTLHRVVTLPTTVANYAEYVKGITAAEVLGPDRVRLRTDGPHPLLIPYLAAVNIVSRRIAEGATTQDFNTGKPAIGTGPYSVGTWARGDRMVMLRNDRYWGPKPAWDQVTFRYIKNGATRVATLLAGDVDLIDTVPIPDVERFKSDTRFRVVANPSSDIVGFVFDKRDQALARMTDQDGRPLDRNPFHDVRVREAVDLAIDRDALRDRVMGGMAATDNQLMRPGQYGFVPDLPPVPYDPAAARALLAAAGYPNGFRMVVSCQNDRFVNDAALCQAIAQMLTRIGINATPEVMPHAVWVPKANRKEFSFFTTFWTMDTPEPSIMLISQFATADAARGRGAFNRGSYSNAAFDTLLDRALTTMDDAARERLLIDATRIAFQDHATVPLHHQFNIEAMVARVRHQPRFDGRVLAADVMPAE